jgi:hypothetical protein
MDGTSGNEDALVILRQLKEAKTHIHSVSVVGVDSLPKRLTWEQDGINYQAYLLAPQYRIEQLSKTT